MLMFMVTRRRCEKNFIVITTPTTPSRRSHLLARFFHWAVPSVSGFCFDFLVTRFFLWITITIFAHSLSLLLPLSRSLIAMQQQRNIITKTTHYHLHRLLLSVYNQERDMYTYSHNADRFTHNCEWESERASKHERERERKNVVMNDFYR